MIHIGQQIYGALRDNGFSSIEAKEALALLRLNYESPRWIVPLVVGEVPVAYIKVNAEGIVGVTFYEDPGSQEVKKMFTSKEANFCEIRYLVADHECLQDYTQQMHDKDREAP